MRSNGMIERRNSTSQETYKSRGDSSRGNSLSISLDVGDVVHLQKSGKTVAKGFVFCTDPRKECHNVSIGVGNISVSIIHAMVGYEDEQLLLARPDDGTVKEAVSLIVRWKKHEVVKIQVGGGENDKGDDIPNTSTSMRIYQDSQEEVFSTTVPDSQGRNMNCDGHLLFDFESRKSWEKRLVFVYASDKTTLLADAHIIV